MKKFSGAWCTIIVPWFVGAITILFGKWKDRYECTAATINHSGQDVDQCMVQSGMAWHYKKYVAEQPAAQASAYAATKQAARSRGHGLWVDANPMEPWDWRHGGATMHKNR